MLGGVQKQLTFLDKSTWTLATILIALILLSSLSFTGTLSDTVKIIDNTETAAPVAPLHQYKSTSYRINITINYKKCQPVKAGIFYKKYQYNRLAQFLTLTTH
jgi:hypothetical protein